MAGNDFMKLGMMPLYKPKTPSCFNVFSTQSVIPVNATGLPFIPCAWRRVRTSCNGYVHSWPHVVDTAPHNNNVPIPGSCEECVTYTSFRMEYTVKSTAE